METGIFSLTYIELFILIFLLMITYISYYYIGKYINNFVNKKYKTNESFSINKNDSCVNEKKKNDNSHIQMLSPLYLPCTNKDLYKKKDYQLPWCKGWGGGKSNLKCFVNKHLQRKCYWSCNNN